MNSYPLRFCIIFFNLSWNCFVTCGFVICGSVLLVSVPKVSPKQFNFWVAWSSLQLYWVDFPPAVIVQFITFVAWLIPQAKVSSYGELSLAKTKFSGILYIPIARTEKITMKRGIRGFMLMIETGILLFKIFLFVEVLIWFPFLEIIDSLF